MSKGKSGSEVTATDTEQQQSQHPVKGHGSRVAMVVPAGRVDYIMTEMAENRWRGWPSVRDCSERFGVARQVIERDAAEAGRTLARLHAGTPEQRVESRGRILARLDKWRQLALTSGRMGGPDMSAIAKLEDIEAKLTGAYAAQRHEFRPLPERSPEERLQALREANAVLPGEIAELEEQLGRGGVGVH